MWLAAAEIPSIVAADDAGGAYPFDLTGVARLFVVQEGPELFGSTYERRVAEKEIGADDPALGAPRSQSSPMPPIPQSHLDGRVADARQPLGRE